MIKIKSDKACSLNIQGVNINPQLTELTKAEYDVVKGDDCFKALVGTGNIVVIGEVADKVIIGEDGGDKELEDLKVPELKALATQKSLTIPSNATKAQLVELIKLSDEQ